MSVSGHDRPLASRVPRDTSSRPSPEGREDPLVGGPDRAGAAAPAAPRFRVAQLDEIAGVPCPCGVARRAFAAPDNPVATLHMTDITTDARTHYHKRMTELYFVLEGEGFIELDGERVPVRPNTSVLIKPGCRHRAIGRLRILNIPVPAFDEADEFFD